MVRYSKPTMESLKRFMECDICEVFNHKELLTLKPDRFSLRNGTQKERNAKRVCFRCALHLYQKRIYNFSQNWRNVFFDFLERTPSTESNREKYKKSLTVIHE